MKAVVLVSGGLDSAVCLAGAVDKWGCEDVLAVSMYYGQKHDKELECARKLAEHYNVRHMVRDLSEVFKFSDCSLLQFNGKEVAHGSYAEQQKEEGVEEGAVETYVPFRNGLFLSYVATIAYSVDAEEIIYGAHADDAAGNAYPDCSADFYDAIQQAINIGTGKKVDLKAPLIDLNKAGVVKLGISLKVPFHLTWSCYEGNEKACGQCGTCIDRLKAFEENNMIDPIEYVEDGYRFEGNDIIFDVDYLKHTVDPIDNAIQDTITDVSRWSIFHDIVFEFKGKYYRTSYSIGATEMQDERPWEDESEVYCHAVEEKEVTKKEWILVKE